MGMEKRENRFTDLSAENGFLFEFHCDRCGRGERSERYEFSPGDLSSPPSGEVREMIWLHQHRFAFLRAEQDARYLFNTCPVCGRRVCCDCFRVTDDGCGDMCLDCLEAAQKESRC